MTPHYLNDIDLHTYKYEFSLLLSDVCRGSINTMLVPKYVISFIMHPGVSYTYFNITRGLLSSLKEIS